MNVHQADWPLGVAAKCVPMCALIPEDIKSLG